VTPIQQSQELMDGLGEAGNAPHAPAMLAHTLNCLPASPRRYRDGPSPRTPLPGELARPLPMSARRSGYTGRSRQHQPERDHSPACPKPVDLAGAAGTRHTRRDLQLCFESHRNALA
jgi:hypothetical protein